MVKMKTSKQREEDFRKDWEELLKKHGAECWPDYDEGGIEIMMLSVWANKTDIKPLAEHSEFSL